VRFCGVAFSELYWRSQAERRAGNWSGGSPVQARLMADGTATGRPLSPLDMITATVAQANDCVVVVDHEKDFAGLAVFNPMRAGTK
jgi:hypothetical protein